MARMNAQWINKNGQQFDITQTDDLTLLFKPLGGLASDAQGIYVTGTISNLRADVLDRQTDATLDPGATPSTGDRYIIEDSSNLHANFGTIAGIEDDDIVEYDGTDFVVTYDASTDSDQNALAWVSNSNEWWHFNGTQWHLHQGLSSLTAGNGLVITAGQIDLVPDTTTGGDIAPINVVANGVGVDVNELDGDHLNIDWDPTNYNPDASIAEAANTDDLSAHLKGIDNKLADMQSDHLEQTINQISHGFSVNQVVRMNSGSWALAQADTASHAEAIGVVDEVIDANNFVVVTHGVTTNLTGLTADTVYYLDPTTAGALTTTPPATVGQVAKAILYAKSTTEAYVYDRIGIEVADTDPRPIKYTHTVSSTEETAGYFVLTQVPSSADLVSCTPINGPQQLNASYNGITGTPDFQILGASADEFHFNNNGAATGLSGDITAGDELILEYLY